MLLELKRMCKLPFSTMVWLLQLLCPKENLLPTTKYQLLKFSRQFSSHSTRINFCSCCGTELGESKICSSLRCEPCSLIMTNPAKTLVRIIAAKALYTYVANAYKYCKICFLYTANWEKIRLDPHTQTERRDRSFFQHRWYIAFQVVHSHSMHSCQPPTTE